MDWQSPEKSRKVILGVIKLAAKSEENPVPPLFMNPGVGSSLASPSVCSLTNTASRVLGVLASLHCDLWGRVCRRSSVTTM